MTLKAAFEATGQAPHEARELVRHEITDVVSAPTLADVLTIVSELVANAVTHGGGSEARVRLDVAGDTVVGEVENDGYAELEFVTPSQHDLRGLGLRIVDAIADDWGAEHGGGAVTLVRFEVSSG